MAEKVLPPGFRFHPTDEELITNYLLMKVSDPNFTTKAVAIVDLNKSEPWDLPSEGSMGEKEWYFFSLKERKYPTGLRTNRATESGYWKTTGKDKEIYGGGVLIGLKKTLVFYKGRAPRGEKSNWVMHEYRLLNNHPFTSSSTKEEWVVCRVFQKSSAPKKPQQQISSPDQQSQEDSPCNYTSSIFNDFGDHVELPNINGIANSSTCGFPDNTGCDNDDNTNMMMNLTNDVPSLPWPSGLLLNPLSLSVNSLLLKALQLRSYNLQREAEAANYSTDNFATYGNNNPHEQGFSQLIGTDDLSSNHSVSAASRVLECMSQQQEQPFININMAPFGG